MMQSLLSTLELQNKARSYRDHDNRKMTMFSKNARKSGVCRRAEVLAQDTVSLMSHKVPDTADELSVHVL